MAVGRSGKLHKRATIRNRHLCFIVVVLGKSLGTHRFQRAWLHSLGHLLKQSALEAMRAQGRFSLKGESNPELHLPGHTRGCRGPAKIGGRNTDRSDVERSA